MRTRTRMHTQMPKHAKKDVLKSPNRSKATAGALDYPPPAGQRSGAQASVISDYPPPQAEVRGHLPGEPNQQHGGRYRGTYRAGDKWRHVNAPPGPQRHSGKGPSIAESPLQIRVVEANRRQLRKNHHANRLSGVFCAFFFAQMAVCQQRSDMYGYSRVRFLAVRKPDDSFILSDIKLIHVTVITSASLPKRPLGSTLSSIASPLTTL